METTLRLYSFSNVVFRMPPTAPAEVHVSSSTSTAKKNPTPEQLRDLCCILAPSEMSVYQTIVMKARNLPDATKTETLQDVFDTCSINDQERQQYRDINSNSVVALDWNKWQQEQCHAFQLTI